MKTLIKSLFALAALAMVSTTGAQAQTILRVSGSTAYRAASINAIAHVLTSPVAVYVGSSLAGANDCAFQGTFGGNPFIVECHFGGSITGVAGLTVPQTYNFMQITAGTPAAVTPGGQSNFYSPYGLLPSAGGGTSAALGTPDVHTPDVGFSDAFQNTATIVTPLAKSTPGLTDTQVGILPFTFMKGAANTGDTDFATWQRITDITGNNATTLLGNGFLNAQILTGNPLDGAAFAYAVGRDEDSGTRIAAFAESGFGVGTPPQQYEITTSGGAANGPTAVVASVVLQANSSFPSISGGYGSGGNVADAICTSGWDAAAGGYAVAYIGAADTDGALVEGFQITAGVTGGSTTYTAASLTGSKVTNTITVGNSVYVDSPTSAPIGTVTAVNTGTKAITVSASIPAGTHAVLVDVVGGGYQRPAFLTFNGVTLTKSNVINGKYQFWEYEHFLYPSSFTASPAFGIATAIKTQLINTDSQVAGYRLGDMTGANGTTTKSSEGATINLQ